jgi:hypothetical protein
LTLGEAGLAQPKTGRGAGQSPAIQSRREAPQCEHVGSVLPELSDAELAPLIQFIKILDRWDWEAHGTPSM